MGKCIVCNKSVGPFYSLHKACLPVYESTNRCLQQAIADAVQSVPGRDGTRVAVEACLPSSAFSPKLFDTLIRKAWQAQATRILKSKSPDPGHAGRLLDIAQALGLEHWDVAPHLFMRLSNVEHLAGIMQGKKPSKSFPAVPGEIGLEDDESLLWMFEGVHKVGQKKIDEPGKWALFQTILNSQFRRSRYRKREIEVQARGKLVITDHNIYYVTEQGTTKLGFADIYAITPLEDGVRIQPVYRDSMSSTYITGDGRFTYALLHYAQVQAGTLAAK